MPYQQEEESKADFVVVEPKVVENGPKSFPNPFLKPAKTSASAFMAHSVSEKPLSFTEETKAEAKDGCLKFANNNIF